MAVRRGKWKLVVNGATYEGRPDGNKPLEGDDAVFLSDVEQDPGESHNLRRKHPDLTDEMQSMLYRWREDVQGK
ncbi:MAG: hypothetical protein WD696_14745 [Bryobacteraceae bacterium]